VHFRTANLDDRSSIDTVDRVAGARRVARFHDSDDAFYVLNSYLPYPIQYLISLNLRVRNARITNCHHESLAVPGSHLQAAQQKGQLQYPIDRLS
jgi:hypothetical protein